MEQLNSSVTNFLTTWVWEDLLLVMTIVVFLWFALFALGKIIQIMNQAVNKEAASWELYEDDDDDRYN